MQYSKERYIGYGKMLDLPSGRFGGGNPIKILVLPVKPENVTSWRTHSVKVGESKYKQSLINEH